MKNKNTGNLNIPDSTKSEKKQTRFLFTCVANILYVFPCLMSLGIVMASEGGVTPPLIFAFATVILAVPFAILVLNLYKKKKGRTLAILCSAVMIALHIVCASLLGTWYLVLAPAMILDALLIVWSDVIVNH
ncbi:MAG: hypothetical protein E7672_01395 [Ruminococcaceae bacterium]|nr:hypothetical protein [Oscillospiraceae bacterium]